MKKNISSRVMSAVLGAALLVSSGVPVYASGTGNSDVTLQVETGEEPSIVSVKVPTEIPLKMDKEGVVTVPQDLKITNLSDSTDVELTGLSVTGKDSWVVKDYSEDLSSKAEGTKELSMSFRGDGTTSTGDVSLTEDSWVVNRSSELLLNVSAKLPKQGSEYKEKGSIAQVNYTFSVKDEPTDPVEQFTVNYVAGENGSVNESSRSFSKGSSLTFPSATPSEGYVFDKWVDSDTELEVTGSTTVNANMTVKALFKLDDSDEPIESTISNDWSKDKVIKDSITPVTFNYDSTSPDTHIVSVESDNRVVTVEKGVDTYSLGNSGSEVWNVQASNIGIATVTATLNTGETTTFTVNVYELNIPDGDDSGIEIELPDKKPGDNLETGDITIDIPIKNPDGSDGTITVTPEIPDDTPSLVEGENNINVYVNIDGNINININILINVTGGGQESSEQFTVNYITDGNGIVSEDSRKFNSGTNLTFPSLEPINIAYTFDKWVDNNTGKEISSSTIINSDMVIKAVFKLRSSNPSNWFEVDTNGSLLGFTDEYTNMIDAPTDIVVPKQVGGVLIESIGEDAFKGRSALTSIVLPDGITVINESAFEGCKNLEDIVIPNTVNTIRAYAFKGCNIQYLELSENVKTMGATYISGYNRVYYKNDAFSDGGCKILKLPEGIDIKSSTIGYGFEEIYLPKSIVESSYIYNSYGRYPLLYSRGSIGANKVYVAEGTESIGSNVFGYTIVNNVYLPSSINNISSTAFKEFEGTINIDAPENSISGAPWGASNAIINWLG